MGRMAFEGQEFKTQSPLGMQIKRMGVQRPRSQGFVSVSGRVYLQVRGRLSVVVLGRVLSAETAAGV